jgi:hypothetical protein
MRILLFILTILTTSATAQINAYNIRIGSDKDQDSVYCLLTATTGSNFAGRGEFKSLPQLAALLDDYIAGTGGTSDGDKGDVTVSGGVWTIDNSAITNGKILNDAVDHNKIATDAVRAAEIQAGAVGSSEIVTDAVGVDEIAANSVGSSELAISGVTAATYTNPIIAVDEDGRITTAANGTDVIGDQAFYDYGTTDTPTTADDSIETTNVKYLLFNGLTGGLDSKIELLKESTIQIDHGTSAASRYEYFMKVKPLQQTDDNPNFNFTIASTDITGTKNNEVAMIGWNVSPGGSREDPDDSMLALAWENHYEIGGEFYNEFHLLHTDTSGNVRRPMTFFLDKGVTDTWSAAFHVPTFEMRQAETSDQFYMQFRSLASTARTNIKQYNPSTGTGIEQIMDEDDNIYIQSNDGLIDPKYKINGFDTVVIIGGKVGIETETPYATLTTRGDVGQYSTNSTSGGSPIGSSLYLGDDGYYNSSFYNKAPGLSAVYNAAQGVASDLAFYAFNGARSEKMRLTQDGMLGINDTTPTYTVDVTGDIRATGNIIHTTQTPASSGAAGVAGTITWDASYIYICTATNTWKRVAISTW